MLQGKKMKDADIGCGIVMVCIFSFTLYESLRMPIGDVAAVAIRFYTAPGFLPAVLSIILLILSVALIIHAVVKGGNLQWLSWSSIKALIRSRVTYNVLFVLGLLACYIIFLLEFMPYWLATFIFLVLFMGFFRAGRLIKISLISGIVTAAVTILFGYIIKIPLP